MSLSKSIIIENYYDRELLSQLTQLLQHLIALVKDEMFQVLQVEFLVPDESENSSWGADNDVRCHCLQGLFVLLNRHAAKEHCDLNARHIFTEALVFLADLESEFSSVAHDQDVDVVLSRLDLLKCGKDENGSLSHTRLCLTENIHPENGLWNALVLD